MAPIFLVFWLVAFWEPFMGAGFEGVSDDVAMFMGFWGLAVSFSIGVVFGAGGILLERLVAGVLAEGGMGAIRVGGYVAAVSSVWAGGVC